MDADFTIRTGTAAGTRGTSVPARLALALLAALGIYLLGLQLSDPHPSSAPTGKVAAEPSYGQLPLAFEPNAGRAGHNTDFIARSSAGAAFIGDSGARVAISGRQGTEAIGLRLVGASSGGPRRLERLPGVVNDLHGNDASRWRIGIPTYARVRYPAVYDGIDVEWHGNQRQLEYDFRIAPGADVGAIAVRVAGADRLRIVPNGDVVIRKGSATFRQKAPLAYQPQPGERRTAVGVRFAIADGNVLRFDLGRFDHDRPLVIDPTVLAYSTYEGGGDYDAANAIAVDGSGAAYLAGRTVSSDFDTTGAVSGNKAGSDAFVAKLNPAGNALIYSTYVGGNGADRAAGIAVDKTGGAYAVGTTESTDFTTTPGAFAPEDPGDRNSPDAFVLKLTPGGDSLAYSTYLGGKGPSIDTDEIGGSDEGTAIAVDASGAAYVAGRTETGGAADKWFPTTASRIEGNTGESERSDTGQAQGPSFADAFVSKLNPAGSALEFSTYLGGNKADIANAIAVDASGAAYVAGATNSTDFNTKDPIEGTQSDNDPNNGYDQFDAFVAKIDPQQAGANALIYSTYLGGANFDAAHAIAVDGTGAAYITGTTDSGGFDTKDPIDTNGLGPDAFVSKLTPAGSALAYSTLLSGNGADSGNGIALDSSGAAYIAGHTESNNFNMAGAIEGDSGSTDAFVSRIAPNGTSLGCSTYLGGVGDDRGRAIAVDTSGEAYVAGSTDSSDFNRKGGLEGDSASTDAFVSKLDLGGACVPGAVSSGPASGDRNLHVFVIVLDGLRPREIDPNLTPNLHALKESGTWYKQARSVMIAETLPNHAAMMTGTLPERNGVLGNDYYEPGGTSAKGYRMQMPEDLGSETLFTSLEESCGISTAAVQSKQYLWRLFAGEAPSPSDPAAQRRPDYVWDPVIQPGYIIKPDDHIPDAQTMDDGFLPWFREQDPDEPQFAFVNLGDIDRSGHVDASGPYTSGDLTAFRQGALADTDRLIGSFVDELKDNETWDNTVLIVASDHGMDWSLPDHRVDARNSSGNAAAVERQVLNGGAAMLYIKQENQSDIPAMAKKIRDDPAIQWVATRTRVAPDIPTLHDVGIDHPRAGDIVAFAEPGWRFDFSGEADSNPLPGNHGHSITQHSTLFVTGGHPSLADAPSKIDGKTVYDPSDHLFLPPAGGPGNLSIAPTVAALYGLEPPPGGYDGKPLVEAFDDGVLDPHGTCIAGTKLPSARNLKIGDVRLTEGDEGTRSANLTVSLSAPYPRAVTVDYATADGSATQPSDYERRAGSITLAPNVTRATVSVPIKGDTRDEPDETFKIKLSNIKRAKLADASATATIVDDDGPGGGDGPRRPRARGAVRCDGRVGTIIGTARADRRRRRLVGTRRRDVIAGRGGGDRADGKGAADSMCGNRGNDVLRGGRGRDRAFGGPRNDTLIGGRGRDLLIGGRGRDRIRAIGGSKDRIKCGPGRDVVQADRGDRVGRSCENVVRARPRRS